MVPGLFVRVQEGGIEIAKSDDTRINDEIRAPRVRLIGVDGSQLGLFDTRDAQRIADDQNLDLVEIAQMCIRDSNRCVSNGVQIVLFNVWGYLLILSTLPRCGHRVF